MAIALRDKSEYGSSVQTARDRLDRRIGRSLERLASAPEGRRDLVQGTVCQLTSGRLICDYSLGRDLGEIRSELEELVASIPDSGMEDFQRVLWLGFCLGIDPVLMDRLRELTGDSDQVDRALARALFDERKGTRTDLQADTYGYGLVEVLLDPDENRASTGLVEFVESKWYKSNQDRAWWGSHNEAAEGRYYGYWALDAAAVAAVRKLDDSSLKGFKHYPYDLARFTRTD